MMRVQRLEKRLAGRSTPRYRAPIDFQANLYLTHDAIPLHAELILPPVAMLV